VQKEFLRSRNVENPQSVYDLIGRVIGSEWVSSFALELESSTLRENEKHYFQVSSNSSHIILTADEPVSLAVAFNWYLKTYCLCQFSWTGDQCTLTSPLPRVPTTSRQSSPTEWSYYQNTCTSSYSYVWWDWERWEREIDWMAMNGINLPLSFVGQELVWQETFLEFGLREKDLEAFFTGPAFLAWGRMGNIKGWGGPLTQTWLHQQYVLQQDILSRQRELGMRPVLPAFAGFVPQALKNIYPNATITTSEDWNNFPEDYCCVGMLDPNDSLFTTIGQKFIEIQTQHYGTDHIYNCDTFNENRPSSNDPAYLAASSSAVFSSMIAADPDAIWLMQGWLFIDTTFWHQPQIKALLSGVPDDRMIILDLYSENIPFWATTDSYYGKSFIWCMLHNFGGNIGLYGTMLNVSQGPIDALNANTTMVGVGITMEGINQNYVMYDMALDMKWQYSYLSLDDWVPTYADRRYGKSLDSAHKAWDILRKTAYNCLTGQSGVTKSMIDLRPALEMNRTGWQPTVLHYDPADLVTAWDYLVECQDELAGVETYLFDLADVTRQVLSNLFITFQSSVSEAYLKNGTYDELSKNITRLMALILDVDSVLATTEYYLLGDWLETAKSWAVNDEQKTLYEYNARNQITLWGPQGEISDYASKQWSGLLSDYYYGRWTVFTNALLTAKASGVPFNEDQYSADCLAFEESWNLQQNTFPTEPVGDTIQVVNELYSKYRSILP